MPTATVNGVTLHYEQQGRGEPLVLIPYLAADHACYAFQVAEYAKSFTCISLDLRGTGESSAPDGPYSTEQLADDVAGLMRAANIEKAHVAGLSLGAAVGAWLAAKYPERVLSLSLHGGWTKTDGFIRTVIDGWRVMATALNSVADTTVRGIFPWCFTPELYAEKPDYIESLAAFVRSRPPQTVAAFHQQVQAVATHDVESQLDRIAAPTLITFGEHDLVTRRFADPLKHKIRRAELAVFDRCSHGALYEHVAEFNEKTLLFLHRQAGAAAV